MKSNALGRLLGLLLLLGVVQSVSAIIATAQTAESDLASVSAADLAEMVRSQKDNFRQTTAADLSEARERWERAASRLGRLLDRNGENGQAWKQYLRWDVVEAQLADDVKPDPQLLSSVYERLARDHEGLEREDFAGLRLAVRTYADLARDAANPNASAEFNEKTEALVVLLQQRAEQPDVEQLGQIGTLLGWLARHNQLPDVVAAVRRHYCHPNLEIRVSQAVVAASLRKPIEMITPVDQEILRAKITGTGHTVGKVEAALVPDKHRAVFDLNLTAVTTSETVGVRGPVRVNSTGRTELTGHKRIAFDARGFTSLPTTSTATTDIKTTGVSTKFKKFMDRIVRKLAIKQIKRKQEEGNRLASRYAEQMMNREMDQQVDDMLDQINTIYVEKIRNPLLRRDDFPRELLFHSSADALRVTLLQANASQLAAPQPAPELPNTPDLSIVLHESAVNNFAAAVLGGKEFSGTALREQLARLRPDPEPVDQSTGPRELQISVPQHLLQVPGLPSEDTGMAVTLARQNPVILRLDDGVVSVTVRADRFVEDSHTYPPMNITVRYTLEKTATGMRAAMQGEPEIVPPRLAQGEAGSLSDDEIEIRDKLKEFLDEELGKELVSDGLALPDQLDLIGKLPITHLSAENGWFAFACEQESDARTADTTNGPAVPDTETK